MESLSEWIETARTAGFRAFELVDPAPDSSMLSGYGGGSDHSLNTDITYTVGGQTVTVATECGAVDGLEEILARSVVVEAVEGVLGERLAFPLTLSLSFEERAIDVDVDGSRVTFRGIATVGDDGFTVHARVGADTFVTITTTGVMPIAIRRRLDSDTPGPSPAG